MCFATFQFAILFLSLPGQPVLLKQGLGSRRVPESERCGSEQGQGGCRRVCRVGKDCTRSAPLPAAWEGSSPETRGVGRVVPESKKSQTAGQANNSWTLRRGRSPAPQLCPVRPGRGSRASGGRRMEKIKKPKAGEGEETSQGYECNTVMRFPCRLCPSAVGKKSSFLILFQFLALKTDQTVYN